MRSAGRDRVFHGEFVVSGGVMEEATLIEEGRGSCPMCSAPVCVQTWQPKDPETDGCDYETYSYQAPGVTHD